MKKLYFSIALSCFALAGIAQKADKIPGRALNEKNNAFSVPAAKPHAFSASRNMLFSSDFSDPSEWIISNTGTPSADWVIGTDAPACQYALAAINSTTAANGFAMFDSDCLGNEGDVQNADLTIAAPFQTLGIDGVILKFEQFYRDFSSTTTVQVSTDNGNTWTDFEVNAALAVNASTPNPDVVLLNISSAAANQANVLIRFNYQGEWDYAWMIDDVEVFEAPDDELILLNVYNGDIVTKYDYYSIPTGQLAPVEMAIEIDNIGNNDAVNLTGNYTISHATAGSVATGTFNINIDSGEKETVVFTTNYTPTQAGLYTITVVLPDDEFMTNNTKSVNFEVTNFIYGHSHPAINTTWGMPATNNGEFGLGNLFQVSNNQTVYGMDIMFGFGTTPNVEVKTYLYEVDVTSTGISEIATLSEVIYTVPQSAINAQLPIATGTYTTIPLKNPVALTTGKTYLALMKKEESGDRARICASTRGAADFSTILWWPATSGELRYWVDSDAAVKVELNFDPILSAPQGMLSASAGLAQNRPNPFNGNTVISYELTEQSEVSIAVFNFAGERVLNFNEGSKSKGSHSLTVDANHLPAGIYFYTLSAGNTNATKKMVIVK
jgi:hypothetical protein